MLDLQADKVPEKHNMKSQVFIQSIQFLQNEQLKHYDNFLVDSSFYKMSNQSTMIIVWLVDDEDL